LFKRKDRTGQKNKWGGVLICYRDYLEIHEIKVKPEYTKMEAIWLEVISKSQQLLLACIYVNSTALIKQELESVP